MNTSLWFRQKSPTDPFNWCVDGGIWTVKPAACSLANEACGSFTMATIKEPALGANRNRNDIYTKLCRFSDFNLKLEYRCPNMRDVFDVCGNAVKGPRNWGNSGVKIFHATAGAGAEIAIADINWNHASPFINNSVPSKVVPTLQTGCPETGSNILTYGQLCGAVYDKLAPQVFPPIYVAVSDNGSPLPEKNSCFNTLEIGFMSPRYNSTGTRVKEPTVTVKINGTTVQHRVLIPSWTSTGEYEEDVYKAGPNKGNPVYPGGTGWKREIGWILLQEHDNAVQFQNIAINVDWLPMNSSGFDTGWQH